MRKGIPIFMLLVSIVSPIKYIIILALSHIGLLDPPKDAIYAGERTTTATKNIDYVLMADGPSLIPVPTTVVTASIKRQLPVLRYADYSKQVMISGNSSVTNCVVCWDSIEMSEEMRKLCNCEHVFHKKCLDKWVDEGHVTCPLCRSMLLPSHTNPYMLLKTQYQHQQLNQEESLAALNDPRYNS